MPIPRLCHLIAVGALPMAACVPQPVPLEVTPLLAESGCRYKAEGRSLTLDELMAAARHWRQRRVHIASSLDTPFKCVGGAIFALQRAGVKRAGWTAEPPEGE